MNGAGALLGLAFGLGCYLVLAGAAWVPARAYLTRVRVYLDGAAQPTAVRQALHLLGPRRTDSIARRQQRAGEPADPAAHVLRLLIACVVGLALGTATISALTAIGGLRQPVAAVLLLLTCAASGWLLADRRLDLAGRRRLRRAALELPGMAESLALAIGAGAALPHAIEVVTRRSDGVVAHEFAQVTADLRAGASMDRALTALCARLPVPAVTRCVEALRIALDRGTPIVDVMHAQAADARHESRRLLLEEAGRREVAMLVPVVFLVLPAVVVVALFPGFTELTRMA